DAVLLLAQSRLGDVSEHLNSMFIRGYLDWTESKYSARQSELRGLYHIASALGRSLDVSEIAEVGLRETLKVLGLQAGAVWVRDGARLKLAKTIGMQPGEEAESSDSGPAGRPGESAGGRAGERPRRRVGAREQAAPGADDDRPRQPERHQRHVRTPRRRRGDPRPRRGAPARGPRHRHVRTARRRRIRCCDAGCRRTRRP